MSRLSRPIRGTAFFYADQEAALYDQSVELTQPFYWLFQRTLVTLLRYHMSSQRGSKSRNAGTFLDIGCGTGAEAFLISESIPGSRIVGVDISQAMLDCCRDKFTAAYGQRGTTRRIRLSRMDLLAPSTSKEALISLIPSPARHGRYAAIVSSFTLHHFKENEKRRLYRTFYDVLSPGGLFLNADLFDYRTPELRRQAKSVGEEWISRQFTDPDREYRAKVASLSPRAGELREAWLTHVRRENRPLPLDAPLRGQGGGRLGAGIGEVGILRRCGFRRVEFPFRYFQGGIIWAIRLGE